MKIRQKTVRWKKWFVNFSTRICVVNLSEPPSGHSLYHIIPSRSIVECSKHITPTGHYRDRCMCAGCRHIRENWLRMMGFCRWDLNLIVLLAVKTDGWGSAGLEDVGVCFRTYLRHYIPEVSSHENTNQNPISRFHECNKLCRILRESR